MKTFILVALGMILALITIGMTIRTTHSLQFDVPPSLLLVAIVITCLVVLVNVEVEFTVGWFFIFAFQGYIWYNQIDIQNYWYFFIAESIWLMVILVGACYLFLKRDMVVQGIENP